MIVALVLAAGESKRMGMPKPLLRFDTTTFLERIVTVLRRSNVDRVRVVLGSQAALIRASADLSGVATVVHPAYPEGQLSSLIAGILSLPDETGAVVLCLVDSPLISSDVVDRPVGAYRVTGKPIVVPTFAGQPGHPVLFARAVFDELLNAPKEVGARHVVHADEDRVFTVKWSEPSILWSIDTPEDYRACFRAEPAIVRRL